MVRVSQSPQDGRARVVTLTARGRRERATLDQRSDALAASMLKPLDPSRREHLVRAMAEVERLLTAASVTITPIDPEHVDARRCVAQYAVELNQRSTRRFDPAVGATALPHELRPPAGRFFVARLEGEVVGCGAVKHHAGSPAEIKRMWIAPTHVVSESAAACSTFSKRARETPAHASRGSRPTATSPRRSPSTPRPAGSRSSASTTNHSPTAGSKRRYVGKARRGRPGGTVRDPPARLNRRRRAHVRARRARSLADRRETLSIFLRQMLTNSIEFVLSASWPRRSRAVHGEH